MPRILHQFLSVCDASQYFLEHSKKRLQCHNSKNFPKSYQYDGVPSGRKKNRHQGSSEQLRSLPVRNRKLDNEPELK